MKPMKLMVVFWIRKMIMVLDIEVNGEEADWDKNRDVSSQWIFLLLKY